MLESLKQRAKDSLKEKNGIKIDQEILENKTYVDLFSLYDDLRDVFNKIIVSIQQSKEQKNFITNCLHDIKNNPMDIGEKKILVLML